MDIISDIIISTVFSGEGNHYIFVYTLYECQLSILYNLNCAKVGL